MRRNPTHTGYARVEQDPISKRWAIVVYPNSRAASRNIFVVTDDVYLTSKSAEPDWHAVSQMLDAGVEPHDIGSYLHRKDNPADWLQAADAEIEADGTEGAFTRQARRAGYSDTLDFAAQVKEDYERWVHLGKPGRAPYVLKTYRRATFALNAQKRNPSSQAKANLRFSTRRLAEALDQGDRVNVQRHLRDVQAFAAETGGPNPPQVAMARAYLKRRNPRRSTGGAYRTKAGEHGTLYLWRIPWRDRDPSCHASGSVSAWAYDSEHAIEEAIGNLDGNGWEYESDYTLGRPKRAKA